MNLYPNGIIFQELCRPTKFSCNFNYDGLNAYYQNPLSGINDAACKELQQFPKLQAISISFKPADAISLTDAQKRTGDCFRQEFGSPALPFAQKRLYLRPQHLNRDSYRGCTAADTAALCLRRDMCCLSSSFSGCFLPRIVQHFAHFSHLPVTYCTTFCCSCQE